MLVGGVLDLSLVTSTRFVTTAIACEQHHIIWIINAFSGFCRTHCHEMTASYCLVLIHLCHSETIVRHICLLVVASTLLECCILLGSLCSIHSWLRVLCRSFSRIVLALLITTTATIFLILRACDFLPRLIIINVHHVIIASTISRKALILTRHGLLEGNVIACNCLPWSWTVISMCVGCLLNLFITIYSQLLLRLRPFNWTDQDLLWVTCKSSCWFL